MSNRPPASIPSDGILTSYMPVDPDCLLSGASVPVDLYLWVAPSVLDPRGHLVLYRSRALQFTDDHRRHIENVSPRLFIRNGDMDIFREYLYDASRTILRDPDVQVKKKVSVYISTMTSIAEQFFRGKVDYLGEAENIADVTAEALFTQQISFPDILAGMAQDYNLSSHSMNVSVIAAFFASRLGMDEESIRNISTGALLHDVGKKFIPKDILYAPRRLTPEEMAVIRRHAQLGYMQLQARCEIRDVLNIILLHHEWKNGQGYPRGLAGDQIPQAVHVVTFADVFDALTSRRCYKAEVDTFTALKIMSTEMQDVFDRGMLEVFINTFSESGEKSIARVPRQPRLQDTLQ